MQKILRFLLPIALIALLVLIEGLRGRTIEIRRLNIPCQTLKSNRDVRLLHLSDLHFSRFGSYERRVLQKINRQTYDVVLITGDFVKSRKLIDEPDSPAARRALDAVGQFIADLKAPMGVYACRGNNDFSDDKEKSDRLAERLESAGVRLLVNEAVPIADGSIVLVGIDFPWLLRTEVADFAVAETEQGRVLQAKSSTKNSYSHYLPGAARDGWRDYRYGGKFRLSQPEKGGIGFTFYSQFDRGWDRFYRLRIRAGKEEFCFSHHGIGDAEEKCFPLSFSPDRWHCFLIECRTDEDDVQMRAKVWPVGSVEPVDWQLEETDVGAAYRDGTVGLWSAGAGLHQFDDLSVVSCTGDTLMFENFEATKTGEDPYGWVDFNHEIQCLQWIVDQIPDSSFTIFLAHTPDFVHAADAAGIDLQLSGHTHGGQIRLPIVGALYTPIHLGRRYTQGLFQWGKSALYVNRGVGTAGLPIRLFCRPEATIICLRPVQEAENSFVETTLR